MDRPECGTVIVLKVSARSMVAVPLSEATISIMHGDVKEARPSAVTKSRFRLVGADIRF